MLKPAVTVSLFLVPILATSAAHADTVTTEADTLVVVTPNAPVVVTQGQPQPVAMPIQAPGAQDTPPPPPTANGAPQNEDWNNVSHINGVPVKVGERQDYLLSVKKTNIAANPFGIMFGLYDISVAHAVSRNVAVSFAFTGTDNFYQLSATVPLYFRKTFSGPFLEGGLLIRTSDDECYDCYSSDMSTTWSGPQMMFGWHWTFDSGLNVAFAAGAARRMTNQDDYGSDAEFNGYFRVGYAF
jgi:hypothetical protein